MQVQTTTLSDKPKSIAECSDAQKARIATPRKRRANPGGLFNKEEATQEALSLLCAEGVEVMKSAICRLVCRMASLPPLAVEWSKATWRHRLEKFSASVGRCRSRLFEQGAHCAGGSDPLGWFRSA